jgi:hypothetical protein
MKFRVTSVVWEDCSEPIGAACNTIEDWLTASLGDGSFGDGLDQVVFIVVATEEDPGENAVRAAIFDKLGKYTDPMDARPVRHLSFGLSIPYNTAVSLSLQNTTEEIARLILQKCLFAQNVFPKGLTINIYQIQFRLLFVFLRQRPNNSFKPTPLRGAA